MNKLFLNIVFLLLWVITNSAVAQTHTGFWEEVPGLDGTVDIIRISGDKLIVGGLFDSVNGDSSMSHIALWNGSGWEPMGSGVNGWCSDVVIVDDSNIYVGGGFSEASGLANTSSIAKWDGTSWHSVGGGLNSHVYDIAIDGSDIYAGGSFRNAGGNPNADRIAKWNGSNWESMDKGFNGLVFTIALHNHEIYAGGTFTSADGDTNVKYIARWDDLDSSWKPFGNGLNHQVHHIGFDGNEMYVGGYFTDAGGDSSADCIARWNGTSWEGLGPGLKGEFYSAEVEEFIFDGNDIYVVGLFNVVGQDNSFYNVAKWNGTNWEKLGFGVNIEARAAAFLNDDLYIGGSFSSEGPGGAPDIHYMAKWVGTLTAIKDDQQELISDFKLYQNYPNPFNPITKISWHSSVGSWQTLKIYDVIGNEVSTLVNEFKNAGTYEIDFDAGNLSSGIYFYQLRIEDFIETKKLTLIK